MRKVITTISAIGVFLLGGISFAANSDNPLEGRLGSIYSDHLSIVIPSNETKSNDSDVTSIGEIDIKIDSKTGYDNFHQLSDLREGDPIRVSYYERRNQKIASRIQKLDSSTFNVVATEPRLVTTAPTVTTTTTVTTVHPTVEGI